MCIRLISPLFSILVLIACSHNRQKNNTGSSAESLNDSSLSARANKAYYDDDYEKAVLLFDTLLLSDSLNGEYYFKRAYSQSLLSPRRDSQVVNDYKIALQLGYNKEKVLLNLGVVHSLINDTLALYYFNKLLEVNPNHEKAKKQVELCKWRMSQKQY